MGGRSKNAPATRREIPGNANLPIGGFHDCGLGSEAIESHRNGAGFKPAPFSSLSP